MARITLGLTVIKDKCLGYEVFRGSAPAGQLARASWIDFHDPDSNRFGYQRDFDSARSQKAVVYARDHEKAFWPECILAIRDNDEVEEGQKVEVQFHPITGTEDRFGTLEVTYDNAHTELIDGREVPWRRAFSQVDCQHRLGSLEASDLSVTFCIFAGLTRTEEARIFHTINSRQKRMNSSLVDMIVLLTDPEAPPHTQWAWDLGRDPGSPYNQLVWTGGRGRTPAGSLISLTGLNRGLKTMMPNGLIRDLDRDYCYGFARAYWQAVRQMWPTEFCDRNAYKLQTTPGQDGLARFGREVFQAALPAQHTSVDYVIGRFGNKPNQMNWSVNGPLRLATGKGGQRDVFELLKETFGLPSD